MKKILKYVGYALAAGLIVIQFFHAPKNHSNDNLKHLYTLYDVPADVENILQTSCYDCHSNFTNYPWYSGIQPFNWWLADHINEGKKELNFSVFADYSPRRQFRKMEEVMDEVKEGKMPLPSYTWVHRSAVLSQAQKETLVKWAETVRDTLKARYPIDSLVRKAPAK